MIAKCQNPPKDSEKRRKSEKSKEKGNRACDNSDDDNDLKYTHLWHECLVMSNAKVKTMVTVRNRPIGFWIQEFRDI